MTTQPDTFDDLYKQYGYVPNVKIAQKTHITDLIEKMEYVKQKYGNLEVTISCTVKNDTNKFDIGASYLAFDIQEDKDKKDDTKVVVLHELI